MQSETRTIGDGELILRAYLLWADDCPKHLLGDFAFAIWDPRTPRLFCARDHMGMRQLIYHHAPGKIFAFATEADALVAHPKVPKRVNEARIADFLDDLEGIDFISTFFEEVFRLPPASSLVVDAEKCLQTRYWTLSCGDELRLSDDQAYADAFVAVFTEAVRCRLRSSKSPGSMLSGGMDSNSIAAVAGDLLSASGKAPLSTFSAVSADPSCIESHAIRLASRSRAFTPSFIRSDDKANASEEVERLLNDCSEPFDASMTPISAVYRLARKHHTNVVLDGVAADIVLTAGNRVAGLLRNGNLREAIREARGEARFWGQSWSFRTVIASAFWAAAAPRWARKARGRLIWSYHDWLLVRGRSAVGRDLAKRADLRARRKFFRGHRGFDDVSGRPYRRDAVLHPHLVVARERYDRLASQYAIEPRDPFMDVRLVEFCLSLPAQQLQRDGWPKFILRRAMQQRVPASIVDRPGKPHVGRSFMMTVTNLFAVRRPALSGNVDIMSHAGKQLWRRALAGVDSEEWFKLSVLSAWISRDQRR